MSVEFVEPQGAKYRRESGLSKLVPEQEVLAMWKEIWEEVGPMERAVSEDKKREWIRLALEEGPWGKLARFMLRSGDMGEKYEVSLKQSRTLADGVIATEPGDRVAVSKLYLSDTNGQMTRAMRVCVSDKEHSKLAFFDSKGQLVNIFGYPPDEKTAVEAFAVLDPLWSLPEKVCRGGVNDSATLYIFDQMWGWEEKKRLDGFRDSMVGLAKGILGKKPNLAIRSLIPTDDEVLDLPLKSGVKMNLSVQGRELRIGWADRSGGSVDELFVDGVGRVRGEREKEFWKVDWRILQILKTFLITQE